MRKPWLDTSDFGRRRRAARPAALESDADARRTADFVDGMRTMAVNGDADAQIGMAAHL